MNAFALNALRIQSSVVVKVSIYVMGSCRLTVSITGGEAEMLSKDCDKIYFPEALFHVKDMPCLLLSRGDRMSVFLSDENS